MRWAKTDPATEVHGDTVSNLADTVESDHIQDNLLRKCVYLLEGSDVELINQYYLW